MKCKLQALRSAKLEQMVNQNQNLQCKIPYNSQPESDTLISQQGLKKNKAGM